MKLAWWLVLIPLSAAVIFWRWLGGYNVWGSREH